MKVFKRNWDLKSNGPAYIHGLCPGKWFTAHRSGELQQPLRSLEPWAGQRYGSRRSSGMRSRQRSTAALPCGTGCTTSTLLSASWVRSWGTRGGRGSGHLLLAELTDHWSHAPSPNGARHIAPSVTRKPCGQSGGLTDQERICMVSVMTAANSANC